MFLGSESADLENQNFIGLYIEQYERRKDDGQPKGKKMKLPSRGL